MEHSVSKALEGLLMPLDSLTALSHNPRVGNVEAIMASYEEFGQVKPIVVRPNTDGTATVLAGLCRLTLTTNGQWHSPSRITEQWSWGIPIPPKRHR